MDDQAKRFAKLEAGRVGEPRETPTKKAPAKKKSAAKKK